MCMSFKCSGSHMNTQKRKINYLYSNTSCPCHCRRWSVSIKDSSSCLELFQDQIDSSMFYYPWQCQKHIPQHYLFCAYWLLSSYETSIFIKPSFYKVDCVMWQKHLLNQCFILPRGFCILFVSFSIMISTWLLFYSCVDYFLQSSPLRDVPPLLNSENGVIMESCPE
jgi:hypothetical protein